MSSRSSSRTPSSTGGLSTCSESLSTSTAPTSIRPSPKNEKGQLRYDASFMKPREIVWINVRGKEWKMAVVKSGPYLNFHKQAMTCPLNALHASSTTLYWRVHVVDETEHVWCFWVSPELNVLPDEPRFRDWLRKKGFLAASDLELTRAAPRVLRAFLKAPAVSALCADCSIGWDYYWKQVFRRCREGFSLCLRCSEQRIPSGKWSSSK